jgi:hypothetical protein
MTDEMDWAKMQASIERHDLISANAATDHKGQAARCGAPWQDAASSNDRARSAISRTIKADVAGRTRWRVRRRTRATMQS